MTLAETIFGFTTITALMLAVLALATVLLSNKTSPQKGRTRTGASVIVKALLLSSDIEGEFFFQPPVVTSPPTKVTADLVANAQAGGRQIDCRWREPTV